MGILDLLTGQSGNGIVGQIISFILFMLFITFYSRIMVIQIMGKLERSASTLEEMSSKAEEIVAKKIKKKMDKKSRRSIKQFLEFFAIPPVSTDPFGVMKKLEHIQNLEKDRFKYFVGQVAPDANPEKKANIMMGLSGAIQLHEITKIVRHFVELIKKTKSINLALIIQMQIPLIEKMAKALLHGTEALVSGWPIGDGVGSYVGAKLIGNSKVKEVDEETVMVRKEYKKRNVIIVKAKGPGGRTGNPGKILEKIAAKEKIAKIITIDAAAKLEGEKTGSLAEGVGVALGGIGVERYQIEDVAVKNKIPLDSIIIKMSSEEAIMPMRKSVLAAVPKAIDLVDDTISRTKEEGTIIIVGVGNTSGVGNNEKSLAESEKTIKKNIRRIQLKAKKAKKKFRLKLPFDLGF
jgi:hypothetical protein